MHDDDLDDVSPPPRGTVKADQPAGDGGPRGRPSYADPVAGGMDPTDPESPEQTLSRPRTKREPPAKQ